MKSTDTSRAARAALAACLLVMAFVLSLGSGGCSDAAVPVEISENAVRTAGEIEGYHAVVETSWPGVVYSTATGGREYAEDARMATDEIWVKGPGLRRDSSESFDRQIGEAPSLSTSVINGSTFALMGSDYNQFDYNCPPDLYWQMGSAYDLARELNDLTKEDHVVYLGEEKVSGIDTYKLEKKGGEGEVLWVDQASSICLKKEIHEEGELRSRLEVVSLELNVEIPDSVFFIETEGRQHVDENDMGYREISPDQVPGTCGFEPLLPSEVPESYRLTSTGWRDESVNGLPLDLPVEMMPLWYKPLYLNYTDGGIIPVVICEAKQYETERSGDDWSSFMLAHGPVQRVDLASGVTGYYWNSTLYLLRDGIKVSISAYLPLEELVGIAESLH